MKKTTAIMLSGALILPSLFNPSSISAAMDMSKTKETIETTMVAEKEKNLMEEASITKEEALKIATDRIEIPEGYEQQSVRFQSSWYPGNRSVWVVNWNRENERAYGYIHVSVDANSGDVIEMSHHDNDRDEEIAYPPKVDWSEAESLAKDFVKRTFPDKVDKLMIDANSNRNQKPPLDGNVIYNIQFNQSVDGIPFQNNRVDVRINGNGKIVGYNYRWVSDYQFPSLKGMMKQEDAVKRIKDTYNLNLKYITLYGEHRYPGQIEEPTVALAYEPMYMYPYFDAKEGNWLNHSGKEIDSSKLNSVNKVEPLAEKPLAKEPDRNGKEITQEEALNVFEKHFSIPEDIELQHVSYDERKHSYNEAVWSFNWHKKGERFWMHGEVNALTGEIVSFNYDYPRETKEEEKITYKEAKDIAIEKIKEIIPWKAHELAYQSRGDELAIEKSEFAPSEYHFNFVRLVNGIAAQQHSINVTVSSKTGEVFRYHQNWHENLTFPAKEGVVSLDEAKELYFEGIEIEPKYVTIYKQEEEGKQSEEIKLVYTVERSQMSEPVYLDAKKGAWVSRRTGERIEESQDATDIQGHWAEEPLKLMVEHQAIKIDDAGKVYPDKPITRGEMIKMLMLTHNPYPYFRDMRHSMSEEANTFRDVTTKSEYFVYVEEAVRRGLLDKSDKDFEPDSLVTRAEIAELIVRALNFDELAEYEDMFTITFKDADKIEQKGIVSIVQHLNIMNGIDGYFKPEVNVTRAQAAKVYFEYLKKRSKFQKDPYRY